MDEKNMVALLEEFAQVTEFPVRVRIKALDVATFLRKEDGRLLREKIVSGGNGVVGGDKMEGDNGDE